MKNFIRNFLYYILQIKEKALVFRLDKSLKTSYSNKTSKTILSSTEHMTLTSQTQKNIELVRKNVEDIVNGCQNNPQKLLDYVTATGTKVIKLDYADKILKTIHEEEGFITELEGLRALYLNLCTNLGFSFKSKPIFILRNSEIEPLYMLHHFYKWYSMKSGLPGFDYKTQKNFKKYLKNINDPSIANLSIEDTLALQEAVTRDKEATEFALDFAKKSQGAKNAHKKMLDGGANV